MSYILVLMRFQTISFINYMLNTCSVISKIGIFVPVYLPMSIPIFQKPRKAITPERKFAMTASKRLLEIYSNANRFSALSGQTREICVASETESDVNRFLNEKRNGTK